MNDSFAFTGRDGTSVVAYRWEPDGPPRALVQLTHGMGEHVLRLPPTPPPVGRP